MKYEKAIAEIVDFHSASVFMLASQGRIDSCTAYKRFTNYNDHEFDCFAVLQDGVWKDHDIYDVPHIVCSDVDPASGASTGCKVWS